MDEIYTANGDEPVDESADSPKAAGMPKPWSVYRNIATQVCSVAKQQPAGHVHLHGPDTWQGCWAFIGRRCQPNGAVNTC